MLEKTEPNQEPYKGVVILGPDPYGSLSRYSKLCSEQGVGNCIQIGDGTRGVTFDEIGEKLAGRINKYTQIIILAHGGVIDGKHHVSLISILETSKTDVLLSLLDSLTIEPIKCFLSSCYGGAICPSLKKGSTVITTAESDLPSFSTFDLMKTDEHWRQLSAEDQVLLGMTETPETITYYRGLDLGKNLTHVYRPFYNRVPVFEETVEILVKSAQEEFQSRLRENSVILDK